MILEQIVEKTRLRIQREKEAVREAAMKEQAERTGSKLQPFAFEQVLAKNDIQFICEVKKASPSKELIVKEFPYVQIAKAYEASGAACISVLLICAVLDTDTIRHYFTICDKLWLSALVEAHNADEIEAAIQAGARLIGVNNRNLKDFTVDIQNSVRLRKLVPKDVIFVADIAIVNEWKPDYIGFVFADSRRKVEDKQAAYLKEKLHPGIQAVGVFVNDSIEHIATLCEADAIDVVQLHGDESKEYIRELKERINKPIIRAIRVQTEEDIKGGATSQADIILLDAFHPQQYGGTGEQFDIRQISAGYRPYILAGGLTPQNVRSLISELHPYAVDVSSGVETDGVIVGSAIVKLVAAEGKESVDTVGAYVADMKQAVFRSGIQSGKRKQKTIKIDI